MNLANLLRLLDNVKPPRVLTLRRDLRTRAILLSPHQLDRMFLQILRRVRNLRSAVLHVEKMAPPLAMAILSIPDTIMLMANVLSEAKPSTMKSLRKCQDQLAQCYLQKTPRSLPLYKIRMSQIRFRFVLILRPNCYLVQHLVRILQPLIQLLQSPLQTPYPEPLPVWIRATMAAISPMNNGQNLMVYLSILLQNQFNLLDSPLLLAPQLSLKALLYA